MTPKTNPPVPGHEGPPGHAAAPHPDPHVWIERFDLATTADVDVPNRLIDQIIGQDEAVSVALKAAEQGRNLLLIGDPGVGKSMLAKAMAEVLPQRELPDVVVYHNKDNANQPKVLVTEGGMGKRIMAKYEAQASRKILLWRAFEYIVGLGTIALGLGLWLFGGEGILPFLFSVLIALLFLYFVGQKRPKKEFLVPNLAIEHGAEPKAAPYVDATGSHAGALLGDVRHDPFQSGGLETPPHARVEAGAIHRAHRGVLFVDEINVLRLQSQQALLTAMQDKAYSIVGQSENSSGAMVRTEALPCDFILVAAGNLDAVQEADPVLGIGMHPALRSRIRGYGYEVYVNNLMDDDETNRTKLVQFVAQEVVRDGRIPDFERAAVAEIVREAQRRSGRTGKLTLRLRELGGLVRTAGDMAVTEGAGTVTHEHVIAAKRASRSLEQQITAADIEARMASEHRFGPAAGDHAPGIGQAYGATLVGTGDVGEPAGILVPVEAAVVPALSRHGGSIQLGDRLRDAPGSSVTNVGALLKTFCQGALVDHDIHVDARLFHPDAVGDGIALAVAVAAISALEGVAADPSTALIAEVGVAGSLRAVPGTLQRIEAAQAAGLTRVIVPSSIADTLLVDAGTREAVDIVHCDDVASVLHHVLDTTTKRRGAIVARVGGARTNGAGDRGKGGT